VEVFDPASTRVNHLSELNSPFVTSRRTDYRSSSRTVRVLHCFIPCRGNVCLAIRWLAVEFRICSLPWERLLPNRCIAMVIFVTILSTHLRLCLPSGLFHSGFLTNILHAFLFPFVLHAPPISLPLQVMKLLIMQFSQTCHFISLRSKYSVCVPPLMPEAKFHTHIKLEAKLCVCIF
jgi:hypothetical protein